MKRTHINIANIASTQNLALAAYKAAKAKRQRPPVKLFFKDLTKNLNQLSQDILANKVPYGHYRTFSIRDPKPRIIHAACFEDRVLYHALMNYVSPVLDRAMTTKSFACREGYGVHKAANYALECVRCFPWFIKMDVEAYFASIPHERLLELLKRKFKGKAFLELLSKIINSYQHVPNHGLPIGSLCSQNFANYYLDAFDRRLLVHSNVGATLRYMDDVLVFTCSKTMAHNILQLSQQWLAKHRGLTLKDNWQVNRSEYGVTFCGYRVLPVGLGLSRRRRQRYQARRYYWENLYKAGFISATEFQRAMAAVQSIIQGNQTAWASKNLSVHPPIDV